MPVTRWKDRGASAALATFVPMAACDGVDVDPAVSYPNGKGCEPTVTSLAFAADGAGRLTSGSLPDD